ncbi:hypothetical protein AAVH_27190 [Aphelenchoides avenae]|nr:hypothetical protein AAVH_27190 [Aphelenchus avenae]
MSLSKLARLLSRRSIVPSSVPKVAPHTAATHVANERFESAKQAPAPYKKPSERLTFENTEEIFKHKSNWELIRALVVLRLCSIEVLVRNNQTLLPLMRTVLGKRLFDSVLKATFFGHFVAGETKEEVKVTAEKLRKSGIDPIIDYSIEANVTVDEVQGALTGSTNQLPEAILIPPHVDIKDVRTIHQKYTPHEGYYAPSSSEKKRLRSRSPSRRQKRFG